MRTALITRPAPEAAAFAEALPEGWRAIVSPLLEIEPTGAVPDLTGVTGLIFTSRNAVEAARPLLIGTRLPAFCVGARTAEAARAIGLEATSADGDLAALQHLLAETRPTGRLLHLRGRHIAGHLTSPPGCEITETILYDQTERPLTETARAALIAGKIDAIALFSSRTARILTSQVASRYLATPRLFCLSQNVADALGPLPNARIEVAATPNRTALLDLFRR